MRLSHCLLLAVLLFCEIHPQQLLAADIPAGITVTSRRVDSLAASNLLSAYDAGDGYASPSGRRTLLRPRDAVAVRVKGNETGEKLSDLTAKGSALEGFQVEVQRKDRFALLRGKVSSDPAPPAAKSRLAQLRRTPGLEAVNPTFVDPASGLWIMTSDEIIIALKPGVDAKDYFGADWPRVRPLLGPPGQYVLTLLDLESEAVFAAAQRHAADARVLWAEPNFIRQCLTQLVPNDPQFTNQWHLRNTGQTGGTPGADIHATAAWDRTNGSRAVIVAILDTGFDLSHPDLAANLATNLMEIPGNGIDDDNNGYVDDVRGWNFHDGNNDTMSRGPCLPQTNLWLYWKFNEPSGATVLDSSGNGRNGLLFNGASRVVSLAPILPPGAASVTRLSPVHIRISWTPDTGCLESATALTGPWTAVPSATNGQTIATSPGSQFFRVIP